MVFRYLIAAAAGYLLGSVSASVLLSAALYHNDVRKYGSGNAGATNIARVFGLCAGLLTLAGDMLKAAFAGLAGLLLAGRLGLVIACAGCLLGHSWPVFFRFRGGKGVAVSVCIVLLLDWRLFAILCPVFFLLFALTRRVSACSIAVAALLPLVYFLLHPGIHAELALCVFVSLLVIFQHRANIRRLLRGEEPPFRLKRSEDS